MVRPISSSSRSVPRIARHALSPLIGISRGEEAWVCSPSGGPQVPLFLHLPVSLVGQPAMLVCGEVIFSFLFFFREDPLKWAGAICYLYENSP